METLHLPPTGESLIGGPHVLSGECPCHPEKVVVKKQATTGRRGHGGYKIVRIKYVHKNLEA